MKRFLQFAKSRRAGERALRYLALVLLLASVAAQGATGVFTFVSNGTAYLAANSVTSISVSFTGAPATGDLVVCTVDMYNASAVSSLAVKDGASTPNVYTASTPNGVAINTAVGNLYSYGFYLVAPATANKTINATWTSQTVSFAALRCDEFHDTATPSFDKDAISSTTATASTYAVNTPSISPATSGELLYAAGLPANMITAPVAGNSSTNTPWTGAYVDTTDGMGYEYVLSSSGSPSANFTDNTSGDSYACIIMAFKPGSSGNTYTATPSETNTASDSLGRVLSANRADSETNTASDSLAALRNSHPYTATMTETLTFTDSAGRTEVLARSVTETNAASDVLAALHNADCFTNPPLSLGGGVTCTLAASAFGGGSLESSASISFAPTAGESVVLFGYLCGNSNPCLTLPDWTASHSYAAGTEITPTVGNPCTFTFVTVSGGTSGASGSEPTWSTKPCQSSASSINDNSVTWQPLTLTVENQAGTVLSCFAWSPNSPQPLQTAYTINDYLNFAMFCPSIPSGVTSLQAVCVPGPYCAYLSMMAEAYTGLLTTGSPIDQDGFASTATDTATSMTVSSSGATRHTNEMVFALGGTVYDEPLTATNGCAMADGGTSGGKPGSNVVMYKLAPSEAVQTCGQSWTGGDAGGMALMTVETAESGGGTYSAAMAETNIAVDFSLTRLVAFSRGDSETNTASDSLGRSLTALRGDSETNTASDSLARQGTFRRSDSETNTAGDSLGRLVAALRSASETNTASDTLGRLGAFYRSDSETNTATDGGIGRLVAFSRGDSETNTAGDLLARVATYLRAAAESNLASDLLSGSKNNHAYVATLLEVLTFSDGLARLAAYLRAASESNAASDALGRLVSFFRGDSETNTASDSILRLRTSFAALAETNTASDVLARLASYDRSDTETLAFGVVITVTRSGKIIVLPRHEGTVPGRTKTGTAPVH